MEATAKPRLQDRPPLAKPPTISRPFFPSFLTVKFHDELRVRRVGGRLASTTQVEIPELRSLTDAYGLTYERLIQLPQARLDGLEQRAASRSGRAQPDLGGMFVVRAADAVIEQVAQELLALDAVEWVAFSQWLPEPPCSDIPPATPHYFAAGQQGYHGPNPGIDAGYLWSLGARGQGIRIADCEYGYIPGTEDLCGIVDEPGQTVAPGVVANGWDNHGTAVLGELVGLDNLYGVTGLAPAAVPLFFTEWSVEQGFRRVTAITNAIASVEAGDIVVLEMQTISGGASYGPAELDPGVWSVTQAGTDAGVVVVGAAGNGNEDLDGPSYESYRARGDSGAILVGAGSDSADHSKLGFSTYGSRVNLQGWGQGVFTLGYGYYAEIGGDKRQRYVASFDGTSSAAPFVAGAAALLQSLAEQQLACRLEPREMRQLLIDTGLPQGAGGHIGPFPDLRAAGDALLAQGSCYWPHCGNAIREGAESCDEADIGSCPFSCAADCTCGGPRPGEARNVLAHSATAFDGGVIVEISYEPACSAADHTIVMGLLSDVGSYDYFPQVCGIGSSGSTSILLGADSYYFFVVGNDGAGVEGSYGKSSDGVERPQHMTDGCALVQDLCGACD